jgi:hypothetical protein
MHKAGGHGLPIHAICPATTPPTNHIHLNSFASSIISALFGLIVFLVLAQFFGARCSAVMHDLSFISHQHNPIFKQSTQTMIKQ